MWLSIPLFAGSSLQGWTLARFGFGFIFPYLPQHCSVSFLCTGGSFRKMQIPPWLIESHTASMARQEKNPKRMTPSLPRKAPSPTRCDFNAFTLRSFNTM